MNNTIKDYQSKDIEITGFNELLREEGLVLPPRKRDINNLNGLVVLIKGKPGTGKSTLALQITDSIINNTIQISDFDQARFYSLEQNMEDITVKFASLIIHKTCITEINKNYKDFSFLTNYKSKKEPSKTINLFKLIGNEFFKQKQENIIKCLKNEECELGCDKDIISIIESITNQLKNVSTIHNNQKNKLGTLIEKIDSQINGLKKNMQQVSFPSWEIESINMETAYQYINSPVLKLIDIVNQIEGGNKKNKIEKALPLVIIDGLNILSKNDINKINLHQAIDILRKKSLYTIICYEPEKDDGGYLEYLVDMVINLKQNTIHEPITYWLNEISISKARYQNAVLGWHQYKIRDHGIEVYPSPHFRVHHPNNMLQQLNESKIHVRGINENEDEGKESTANSILEKIVTIKPGSFTVILGARATYKTQFTLDFLFSGAKETHKGLLLSLIDNRESIIKNLNECPRKKNAPNENCKNNCYKNIFHFQQRPGAITPSEFIHYLNERINFESSESDGEIERITFWDLTQIEFRFPLFAEDPMFLPLLMDYFKTKKIAAVVMGSGNAKLTQAAAAMADNVLFCWRDTINYDFIEKESAKQNKTIGSLFPGIFEYNTEEMLSKYDEYLALYVDRCIENLGNEGKSLHTFPINDKNDIVIPNCDFTDDLTIYKVNEPNILKNAADKIKSIVRMQGIGDLN